MSIFKKLTILFIISLFSMCVIGLWINNINTKRIDDLVKKKYIKISNEVLHHIHNKTEINKIIQKNTLEKITIDLKAKREILYNKVHTFGFVSIEKEFFEDEFIIIIKYLDEIYTLKTIDEQNLNDKMMLNTLIFFNIIVLVLIFLYIIKLLSPIKKVTSEIINFSNGNLSSRIQIKSHDEIGTLASSFNNMASSLEELIKTREVLLRDIGHELRTPIAKGKFAIEKIDDFSKKELLKKIFLDLETLTNELIELEKLNSNTLNITKLTADTLILESLNKLYLKDDSKVSVIIEDNFSLDADLQYLTTAIKNLIDNAFKYTDSFPITIKASNYEISIINTGAKLSNELDYYLKPFIQESPQRDGFGLGLSIVQKIVERHHFLLTYTHFKGENIFKITCRKS